MVVCCPFVVARGSVWAACGSSPVGVRAAGGPRRPVDEAGAPPRPRRTCRRSVGPPRCRVTPCGQPPVSCLDNAGHPTTVTAVAVQPTPPTAGEGTISRYREIEHFLRRVIDDAQPGDALLTEADLCERFGVSRMTVRQALQELSNAGLIERQPGRGTFVASRPLHRRPGVFLSFTEEMARRGLTASSRVVSAGIVPARPEEVADLGLVDGAEVVRIERVRLADGVPIALEDAAVLVDHAAVLDRDLASGSLHD